MPHKLPRFRMRLLSETLSAKDLIFAQPVIQSDTQGLFPILSTTDKLCAAQCVPRQKPRYSNESQGIQMHGLWSRGVFQGSYALLSNLRQGLQYPFPLASIWLLRPSPTQRTDETKYLSFKRNFPRKMANVFKRSHEVRFAGRTAALSYSDWRTALSYSDRRTPSVHHKKGRPSTAISHDSRPGKPSFCTSGLPHRGSPRTVVGQKTRKYRLSKPSGYYPNTSTRCYTTTRRSNDTARSQPRRQRRHKPYHGHKDEQTS